MKSELINELSAALTKAQSMIVGAVKDSKNPFFKSDYADLASVWNAIREPLTSNNLSIAQTTDIKDGQPVLVTTLCHSSGQFIQGIMPLFLKDQSPQAMGSAITYARRYALAAIMGVAQIDDDAEMAQARDQKVYAPVEAKAPYAESQALIRNKEKRAAIQPPPAEIKLAPAPGPVQPFQVKQGPSSIQLPTFDNDEGEIGSYVFTFGKYKGTKMSNVDINELSGYVGWMKAQKTTFSGRMRAEAPTVIKMIDEFLDLRESVRS